MCLVLTLLSLVIFCPATYSFNSFNALDSVLYTANGIPQDDTHSEYYFGTCAGEDKKLLVRHDYHNFTLIRNKLVIRAPLYLQVNPTCIYIKSNSVWSEYVKYHNFKFNICICRLIYTYGAQEFSHRYYEWFVPVEMQYYQEWELYFYADQATVALNKEKQKKKRP